MVGSAGLWGVEMWAHAIRCYRTEAAKGAEGEEKEGEASEN